MNYLEGADGHMRFNDKSTPEELATVFNTSKKNFKRALGVLMKKGLIYQNENGTYFKYKDFKLFEILIFIYLIFSIFTIHNLF